MNINCYTNFPGIWKDIGFDKTKNIFYKVNHQDASWEKLFTLPAFGSADKIFVIDQESQSHNYIDKDSRIQVWDSTVSEHPRIHTCLFWVDWVREVEEHMQLCSKLLSPTFKKPTIMFDALLGTLRSHKSYVLDKIKSHELNQFILGACEPLSEGLPNGYITGGTHENGSNRLRYHNLQTANTSCFIPYEIYNQTWYSLVCETRGTGDKYFFTEKLAKPLIAGRIFVLFGQYKQLHYLRQLGFKTFDGIIDESYDLKPDDITRYKKAWQQIEFLMEQDPVKMYDQCRHILAHNRKMTTETVWSNLLIKDMIRVSNQ